MKKLFTISANLKSDKGVTAVYLAIMLVVFIGIAALAVDVGYMMVSKNELQNAADASALAATRQLGHIYEGLSYSQQTSYNAAGNDESVIKQAAIDVGLQNRAAGTNLVIVPADIQIGTWDQTRNPRFVATLSQPDAVQVTARRDSSANGPIATFFARIFNINDVTVTAPATAALTGQGSAVEGGLPVPLGISQIRADNCWDNIKMHPTKDSCAAWHTFDYNHSSENLTQILNDYLPSANRTKKKYEKDPLFESPAKKIGDTVDFTGGDLASNFDYFEVLFNYMKTRDGDGDDNAWTTSVVIYKEEATSCGNASGSIPIVGFATLKITEVIGPSGKVIWGEIMCNYKDEGRGGGGSIGTKGTIPGLVQ